MKTYKIRWRQLEEQQRRACRLMAQCEDYARSIGCEYVMDELVCTEEQYKLLLAWRPDLSG